MHVALEVGHLGVLNLVAPDGEPWHVDVEDNWQGAR